MKILKRIFCKHKYSFIEGDYFMLGWERCDKCGKEKYTGKNIQFTEIKFPTIILK